MSVHAVADSLPLDRSVDGKDFDLCSSCCINSTVVEQQWGYVQCNSGDSFSGYVLTRNGSSIKASLFLRTKCINMRAVAAFQAQKPAIAAVAS